MSARSDHVRRVPERSREKLEVVKKSKVKSRRRVRIPMKFFVGLMCVAIPIVGVLLEQVTLAQSAFKLQNLRQELVVAEEQHEELLLEAAHKGNEGRIERYARDVLGMIDPPTREYIVANVRVRTDSKLAHVGSSSGDAVDGEANAAGSGDSP